MRTGGSAFSSLGGRRWLLSAVLVAALPLALMTAAVAQPRGRGAKPKPPKVTADAGPAADTSGDDGGTPVASSAQSAAIDGGTATSAFKAEMNDGGIKPSPLNPQPNELPGAAAAVPATPADYDRILGEISALRARVADVGDALFHSRIGIAVQTDGDHGKIARLTVSLDDGAVFSAPPNFRADDLTAVYEHNVAPGRHSVTIDVDRKDERDETFRTSQRSRFVVDVPKDQRLGVELRLTDESTMGADFPGDHAGRYELRVRMKAVARAAAK